MRGTATLIEPIMRALGWDVEDVNEVVREFRVKPQDNPVDYGLLLLRKPRLFIESKALGANLDDRRWANQIMGYAAVAGVEWIVLTDGNEWRIYNSHAPVAVEQKLFRTVRVTEDPAELAQTLNLLGKARLEENRIEVLWRAEFVDRQVQKALVHMFSRENDMVLVNYIAGRAESLNAEEIRDSLFRCQASFDFPILLELPEPHVEEVAKPGTKQSPVAVQGTIMEILERCILVAGTRLSKTYKGKVLHASIRQDGGIEFEDDVYDSPSMAAGAARASVIGTGEDGKLPPTNGWTFWEVEEGSGKNLPLAAYRDQLQSAGGGAQAAGQ